MNNTALGITVIFILIMFSLTDTILAQESVYYYRGERKIELVPCDSFIVIDIDEENFIGWDNLYQTVDNIDNSIEPLRLSENSYRLRLSNSADLADVNNSLSNLNGVDEVCYSYLFPEEYAVYLGDNLMVKFKEIIDLKTIDSIINTHKLTVIRPPSYMPNQYFLGTPELTKLENLSLANELKEKGLADYVTMGMKVPITLNGAPNDPYYGAHLYYLKPNQTDFESAYDYVLDTISIITAVFDSGIEDHEDMPSSLQQGGYCYLYRDSLALNDTCKGDNPAACFHGLAVSGIIAAVTNNDTGIAGTASNTKIMMQKIVNSMEFADPWAVNLAIGDAINDGAVIMSNSWSYDTRDTMYDAGLFTNIAWAVQTEGIFVIWSVGHCDASLSYPHPYRCGMGVNFPSAHPDVFAVGASDTCVTPARYDESNYDFQNYRVDAVAPGDDILVLDPMGSAGMQGGLKADCGGGNPNYICYVDGVSFAVPQVAGLAALIMGRRPEFIGNPDTLETLIKMSTGNGWNYPAVENNPTPSYQLGYGRINAARALLSVSRGDVNNDMNLDLLDITYLIDFKFQGGPEPTPNMRLGDVNCDGMVDILDIIYMINYKDDTGPPPLTCFKF